MSDVEFSEEQVNEVPWRAPNGTPRPKPYKQRLKEADGRRPQHQAPELAPGQSPMDKAIDDNWAWLNTPQKEEGWGGRNVPSVLHGGPCSAAASEVAAAWAKVGRPAQHAPDGDWLAWGIAGGRGAGKTRAWSEHVAHFSMANSNAMVIVRCPDANHLRDVALEGCSGLLSVIPKECVASHHCAKGEIRLTNGTRIIGRVPRDPGVGVYELAEMRVDHGENLRIVATIEHTAGAAWFMAKYGTEGDVRVVNIGSTVDNASNMSPAILAAIMSGQERQREREFAEANERLGFFTALAEARMSTVIDGAGGPDAGEFEFGEPLTIVSIADTPDEAVSGLGYRLADAVHAYRDGALLWRFRPVLAVEDDGEVRRFKARALFSLGRRKARSARSTTSANRFATLRQPNADVQHDLQTLPASAPRQPPSPFDRGGIAWNGIDDTAVQSCLITPYDIEGGRQAAVCIRETERLTEAAELDSVRATRGAALEAMTAQFEAAFPCVCETTDHRRTPLTTYANGLPTTEGVQVPMSAYQDQCLAHTQSLFGQLAAENKDRRLVWRQRPRWVVDAVTRYRDTGDVVPGSFETGILPNPDRETVTEVCYAIRMRLGFEDIRKTTSTNRFATLRQPHADVRGMLASFEEE